MEGYILFSDKGETEEITNYTQIIIEQIVIIYNLFV